MSNLQAFLDMIAASEGTADKGENGYNCLVGGKLFHTYADHPRIVVDLGKGLKSTAAGRYQILARYFDAYKQSLSLPDFSPDSQDRIAIQMIREQGAYDDVLAGHVEQAISKVANIWASLPGAGYGQHEHQLAYLRERFAHAGGVVA